MEITWCKSFIAVYEFGGFTAASRVLRRSQSRMSAHVASLEAALGARLLNRDANPPTLTAAGEAFLPYARSAVDALRSGASAVTAQSGRLAGTLSIGSFPSASSQLLVPLIERFAHEHPDVVFQIQEGPPGWLAEAFAHRQLDLAIRPALSVSEPELLRSKRLVVDPMVVVVPSDHRLAQEESVRLADLEGSALITTGESLIDPHVGREYDLILGGVNILRMKSMTVNQPTTVFALVKAGFGIGLIGAMAATMLYDTTMCVRPVADEVAKREIRVYWPRSRPLPPAARELMRRLDARVVETGHVGWGRGESV